ncbi:MAG: 4Fe-4S binding protein [Anaerolineae bacterium]
MPPAPPLIFAIDWNACIQCGACVAVCPQPAGFTSPFNTVPFDRPCRIGCLDCETVCPVSAVSHRQWQGRAAPAAAVEV